MTQYHFKIILCSDEKVEKEKFIKLHLIDAFTKEYNPTPGVNIYPLVFDTTYGKVIFDTWDIDGQVGLRESHYADAKSILLCFDDQNNQDSFDSLGKWIEANVSDIPTTLYGGLLKLNPKHRHITFDSDHNTLYFGIDTTNKYIYKNRFLAMARELTGHQDLEFVETPV